MNETKPNENQEEEPNEKTPPNDSKNEPDEKINENDKKESKEKTSNLKQLFRGVWEDIQRERGDTAEGTVEITTAEGEKKQITALQFWEQMIEEVEEQKKDRDYMYPPIINEYLENLYKVVVEPPDEDASAIFAHGKYYIPRPSAPYLQNCNLGCDQWFLVQDFPPQDQVIKILRRIQDYLTPKSVEDGIILELIFAMENASKTSGNDAVENVAHRLTGKSKQIVAMENSQKSEGESEEKDIKEDASCKSEEEFKEDTIKKKEEETKESASKESLSETFDIQSTTINYSKKQTVKKELHAGTSQGKGFTKKSGKSRIPSQNIPFRPPPPFCLRTMCQPAVRGRYQGFPRDPLPGIPRQRRPFYGYNRMHSQSYEYLPVRLPPPRFQQYPVQWPSPDRNPRFPPPAHQVRPYQRNPRNPHYFRPKTPKQLNQNFATLEQASHSSILESAPSCASIEYSNECLPPTFLPAMAPNLWVSQHESMPVNDFLNQYYAAAENNQIAHSSSNMQIPSVPLNFVNNVTAHQSTLFSVRRVEDIPTTLQNATTDSQSNLNVSENLQVSYEMTTTQSMVNVSYTDPLTVDHIILPEVSMEPNSVIQMTVTEIRTPSSTDPSLTCRQFVVLVTKDPERYEQLTRLTWTAQDPIPSVLPFTVQNPIIPSPPYNTLVFKNNVQQPSDTQFENNAQQSEVLDLSLQNNMQSQNNVQQEDVVDLSTSQHNENTNNVQQPYTSLAQEMQMASNSQQLDRLGLYYDNEMQFTNNIQQPVTNEFALEQSVQYTVQQTPGPSFYPDTYFTDYVEQPQVTSPFYVGQSVLSTSHGTNSSTVELSALAQPFIPRCQSISNNTVLSIPSTSRDPRFQNTIEPSLTSAPLPICFKSTGNTTGQSVLSIPSTSRDSRFQNTVESSLTSAPMPICCKSTGNTTGQSVLSGSSTSRDSGTNTVETSLTSSQLPIHCKSSTYIAGQSILSIPSTSRDPRFRNTVEPPITSAQLPICCKNIENTEGNSVLSGPSTSRDPRFQNTVEPSITSASLPVRCKDTKNTAGQSVLSSTSTSRDSKFRNTVEASITSAPLPVHCKSIKNTAGQSVLSSPSTSRDPRLRNTVEPSITSAPLPVHCKSTNNTAEQSVLSIPSTSRDPRFRNTVESPLRSAQSHLLCKSSANTVRQSVQSSPSTSRDPKIRNTVEPSHISAPLHQHCKSFANTTGQSIQSGPTSTKNVKQTVTVEDERQYWGAPSIFDILAFRENLDPLELNKSPTNYKEDVILRKERRWKAMDEVSGCPNLNLILEMIQKDNEMLEEEERKKKEKEKEKKNALPQAGLSTQSNGQTEIKNLRKEDKKSEIKITNTKSKIMIENDKLKNTQEQHVPVPIILSDNLEKDLPIQLRLSEENPKKSSSKGNKNQQLLVDNRKVGTKQESIHQFEGKTATTTSNNTQQIPKDNGSNVRTINDIKVELDQDELDLLNNVAEAPKFEPEVWVSDEMVLKMKDKLFEKWWKPKPGTKKSTTSSEPEPNVCNKSSQTTPRKQKLSKEHNRNIQDEPEMKMRKSSLKMVGAEDKASEEPKPSTSRDQTSQTKQIEVKKKSNEKLSYADVVRKDKQM